MGPLARSRRDRRHRGALWRRNYRPLIGDRSAPSYRYIRHRYAPAHDTEFPSRDRHRAAQWSRSSFGCSGGNGTPSYRRGGKGNPISAPACGGHPRWRLVVIDTLVGSAAAICTTLSYFPQLKKSWETGETEDLSRKMLVLLGGGLGLWIVYGVLRADFVIIAANSVSLAMLLCILWIKIFASHDARRSSR
jgi:MtN3 and saliva related transmembrane protein